MPFPASILHAMGNRTNCALLAPLALCLSFAAAAQTLPVQTPPAPPTGQAAQAPTQADSVPESSAATFLGRWAQFYHRDWTNTLPQSPAPLRRGLPSPLDSPPFPNSDWSYGGSPVLGEPDTQSYPLMTALNGARSRFKIYGWAEPTINFSTSSGSNLPVANNAVPNHLELEQLVLYAERLPDTVQQQHFDFGFHLTALYGSDYRFTTSKGIFSSQLLDHNNPYGFDPALEYLDLYFPHVAQGMNLRIGRYISIPGIEAQLAPNNYTFSHSLLYSVDPFTDIGVLATVKLSSQWLAQLGIASGHDTAPWASGARPSGTACLSYTTQTVNDNVYVCANGINTARYAYNNIQQYDATWYHKFSKSFHSATEGWFMYQRDVPAAGGPIVPLTNTNAAACHTGLIRCTAPEYALVNFLQYEHSPHNFFSLRTDFLNDKKGQRTGYQTRYSEETLSWTHWIGTTVQVRPEIRFDHAWDRRSYGSGRNINQFTLASDVIYHF